MSANNAMILIAESECAVVESQGHLGNMGSKELGIGVSAVNRIIDEAA